VLLLRPLYAQETVVAASPFTLAKMRSLHSIGWLALVPYAIAAPTSPPPDSVAAKASDPPAFFGAISSDGYTSQKWIDALEKARSTVASLTFDQKVRTLEFLLSNGVLADCTDIRSTLPTCAKDP
jgi:hypothetical protein